jgi:hypothetical protein
LQLQDFEVTYFKLGTGTFATGQQYGRSKKFRRSVNHNKNRHTGTGTETYMDVVVTFALDLEGRVEGDVLLRARLDIDFLIYKTMYGINDPKKPV